MSFDFDFLQMLKDIALTSFGIIWQMTYIVVPLLVVVEILKDCGIMNKIANRTKGFTRYLNLPGEAAIGIVVGLGVGLMFGSGVIYELQRDVKMNKMQLNTLFIGIGVCHAIFEETAVYTATGANLWGILLTRILFAILMTYAYLAILKVFVRGPLAAPVLTDHCKCKGESDHV